MDRITQKHLQNKLNWINKIIKERGINYTYQIDHYNPGDNPYQFKLMRIYTDGSFAEHDVTNYRMTGKEFYSYLCGMLDMIDILDGRH